MDERILKKIRDELIKVAKRKNTVTYDLLASRTTLSSFSNWFYVISDYLDEINRRETGEGRPMMTAVVVTKEDGVPGGGFWDCAFYTCKVWDGKGSKETFWEKELRRVWDYWRISK